MEQHKISEYIDNLVFKKTLCMGFHPDEVYEAICNLTSMYNEVLTEAYNENERLQKELEFLQRKNLPVSSQRTCVSQPEKEPPVFPNMMFTESCEPVEQDCPELFTTDEKVNDEMTDKEIQKLKRGELLEILLEESRQNESLKRQLSDLESENETLRNKLADRKIKIEKAGTLAEAALALNGVFDTAHAAAQQYLDNLQSLYDREKENCECKEAATQLQVNRMMEAARLKCDELTKSTEDKCAELTFTTQERCDAMKAETQILCDKVESETREKCRKLEVSTKVRCDAKMKETEQKTREIEEKFGDAEREIKERCEARERETELRCAIMTEQAKKDAEKHWEELTVRLEEFYRAHVGLRDLLAATGQLSKDSITL